MPLRLFHSQYEECKGSALFLILIAVVLFAALTYAITQSNRGDPASMSKESNSVQASAIIQQGTYLENSFARMMMRSGCAPEEVSFENTVVTGYTNSSARANNACHLFDPAGGGVSYDYAPNSWLITGTVPWWSLGKNEPFFTRQWAVGKDDGKTALVDGMSSWPATADFLYIVTGIKKEVCLQINQKLNVANTSGNPPSQSFSCNFQKYVGNNPNGCKWTIQQVENIPLRAACVESNPANSGHQAGFYIYYHALWVY